MAKVVSRMVWSFRAWRKSCPKWFGVSAHGESYFPNGLELVVAKIWKLTVQSNGHVRLLGHYYSVPHTYVGKKVTVFYTSQHVEIYQYYRLIAQHIRNYQGFGFTTIKEHLPAAHRLYLEEDPTPYLKRAKEIDPVVEDFLQIVIERKKSLLAACKSCKGILSFENKVGKDRLIAPCKYAHKLGVYNYLSMANILTKGLDRIELVEERELELTPQHENIRRKEYYEQELNR
nr:hypothetical protein [Segatella salivae]